MLAGTAAKARYVAYLLLAQLTSNLGMLCQRPQPFCLNNFLGNIFNR